MWAITSIFNPAGYRRRLQNYRRFRAALHVPLAAVELSFTGRWELTEHDADKLVRVTDGDVLWQKERLLNLLVKQLPPECEYVAWIDADVLMQDLDWPQKAIDALTSVPLVQLFSARRDLGPDGQCQASTLRVYSAVAAVREGRLSSALARTPVSRGNPSRVASHGLAWAARRELLEHHGLYDSCVIGGGDTALLCAAYGLPEIVTERWMNAAQRDHYSRWAAGFHGDVRGEVGALTGEIHHLWHGEPEDRRYRLRHCDLAPHDFDPCTDIRPGADGPWRWSSDKPELHALLRNYFRNRREDSRAAESST